MRSKEISSVEQQTQELYLEGQATLPLKAGPLSVKIVEISQQPTKKLYLEKQATLPLTIIKHDAKQQVTQLIEVTKLHPVQEQAQPINKQSRRHSYTSLLIWIPLFIFVLLLIGVLTSRSAIETWISHYLTHNTSSTSVVSVIHSQSTTIPTQPSLVDNTAKIFMDAMLHKEWTTMWLMLSPDAQQLWHGEKDFIHFEQAKFGSLTFTSFSDSSAQLHITWRDPDTTRVYSNVEVMHISLKASATQGLLTMPSSLALTKGLFDNTLFALVHFQSHWRILIAGPADPEAPILVPRLPSVSKVLVPIFMYHHVSNLPVRDYFDYNLTVTTTNFNMQLDWLQKHGYQSISQTELFDSLYYGKALPAHPMILSFDDGYKDVYTNALPALLTHHFRGVFYIITGFTGGNYMTWNQVRSLAQDGMQIASHTIHHVNIGRPPAWTSTQKELLLSKETLESQLGYPIQFFCYPTGEPFHLDSVYEQQKVLVDLFTDGYVGATLDPFSFDSAIQNTQTPYQLPRIRVSGGESMELFTLILNSTLHIDSNRLANGLVN